VALGVGHDRSVDEAQIEVPIPRIYLRRPPQQALGHEVDSMLPPGNRSQERGACVAAHPPTQQLVHFDDDGIQNDQLATELSHQSSSQTMSAIPAIRRGGDGSRIGKDPQSLETSSRR
jgi:hypothetical protein